MKALWRWFARPALSVVVVFYDMRREAERTLYSLTPEYQRGVAGKAYEVIAIDNGSYQPLDPAEVRAVRPQFPLRFLSRQHSFALRGAERHGQNCPGALPDVLHRRRADAVAGHPAPYPATAAAVPPSRSSILWACTWGGSCKTKLC